MLFCYASAANGTRQKSSKAAVFPNLAGFCRFIGIAAEPLFALLSEFPNEKERLMTILEDEALNSGLPPAVLSAYLKKRLGYDKELSDVSPEDALTIRFEHNIFDDGE